jgi:hypothetical protein
MAARLEPRRPAVAKTSATKATQCPGHAPKAAYSTTCGRDATTTDALFSLRSPLPASRCARPKPGTSCIPPHQMTGTRRPQAPCHRQVPTRVGRACALPTHARAATVSRLCHLEHGFQQVFATQPSSREAYRPPGGWAGSRGPPPPGGVCNKMSPQHATESVQLPTCRPASCATVGWRSPRG